MNSQRPLIAAIVFCFVFGFMGLAIFSIVREPPCRHPLELSPDSLPGVGFDLTESYGTMSIYDGPGSITHVTRIDGGKGYRLTMQRLALAMSRHMSPPYDWWHDGGALAGVPDIPRQMLRRARKRIGLPSSSDVGTIASLLSRLRDEAEKKYVIKITHAVISTPDLVALYDEDIRDAAEYAGVTLLRDDWFSRQPRHVYSAYVAYGLNSQLPRSHNSSHIDAPSRSVLSVYLSEEALIISPSVKPTNRTCELAEWAQHRGFFSHRLARVPPQGPSFPHNGLSWHHKVAALVQDAALKEIQNPFGPGDSNVTDIVFLGSNEHHELLVETVMDAVMEIQVKTPAVHSRPEEMAYVASMGAAMMARQITDLPTHNHDGWEDTQECLYDERRRYDNSIQYGRPDIDMAVRRGGAVVEGEGVEDPKSPGMEL